MRAGAVRAAKPRALRHRTAKVLAPAIASFAVAGIALVAIAQGAAPVEEASNVPTVDQIAQSQSQEYGAALVSGEEQPADDQSVTDDRGDDVGEVTVTTPEPEPEPEPSETSEGSGETDGSSGGGGDYSVPDAPSADPGSAQAIAQDMVAARGWGSGEYQCLYNLWEKESNWNVSAENPSSGAYGIPQSLPGSKMASHGSDWATNPATQIAWGLDYIADRYGTPCGAWGKSQSSGCY